MAGLEAASPYAAAASAGLGILAGGYQFFHSMSDEKKAKAELEQMQRPFYQIQDEFYQNRNLAAQQAQGGMTAAAKDYATTQTERGMGAGVQGILASGGSAGDISKLFDVYGRTTLNTAAQDAEMQAKNIQYYMEANKELAGQKVTQWSLNELQPYEDKLAQLTERIAADEQNKWGGIQTAVGSLSAGATGLSNAGLAKSQMGMYDRLGANATDPKTLVDLMKITGGMTGNRDILSGGSPFPPDIQTPQSRLNPYGTNTRIPSRATQLD